MDRNITVACGYAPGMVGRCVEMHGSYYTREAGFGPEFEPIVAAGLAEFFPRLDAACNQAWRAECDGRTVGFVAIDGEDLGNGAAHLRWFIVDDAARSQGVGKRLLDAALGFCDDYGFAETHLWTFRGLDAARRLYEARGFRLTEQRMESHWGREVLEQLYVRKRR